MAQYHIITAASAVALLAEGVDRNQSGERYERTEEMSPSSRRAWIEISIPATGWKTDRSPSSRRAWIEIVYCWSVHPSYSSPSSRRAWIEMVGR